MSEKSVAAPEMVVTEYRHTWKYIGAIAEDQSGTLIVADTNDHALWTLPAGSDQFSVLISQIDGGTRAKDDCKCSEARLGFPDGIVCLPGADGEILVAEYSRHRIRHINRAKDLVSTFAGTSNHAGYKDGPRLQAQFNCPEDIIRLGQRVFVSDVNNYCVRCVDMQTGMVSTIAGFPTDHGSDDGLASGPGRAVRFDEPKRMAISPDGRLLITDRRKGVLHAISVDEPEFTVATVAEQLKEPFEMVCDAAGVVFVCCAGDVFQLDLRTGLQSPKPVLTSHELFYCGPDGSLWGTEKEASGERTFKRIMGLATSLKAAVDGFRDQTLAPCLPFFPRGLLDIVARYAAWPLCWS